MTRGPARTPNEVLRARGGHGHGWRVKTSDQVGKEIHMIKGATEIPKPPRPLKKAGKDLWDRAWTEGVIWLSPQSDIDVLLATCEALDERTALRAAVVRPANVENHRLRRALRDLDKQIMVQLGMLGFSPSDRARLNIAEVGHSTDELAQFRAKAAKAK